MNSVGIRGNSVSLPLDLQARDKYWVRTFGWSWASRPSRGQGTTAEERGRLADARRGRAAGGYMMAMQ